MANFSERPRREGELIRAMLHLVWPPSHITCNATTNSLDVQFSGGHHIVGHSMYEVQIGLQSRTSFMTQTAMAPRLKIEDLQPNTQYDLRIRKRTCKLNFLQLTCSWSGLSETFTCSTNALAPRASRKCCRLRRTTWAASPCAHGCQLPRCSTYSSALPEVSRGEAGTPSQSPA